MHLLNNKIFILGILGIIAIVYYWKMIKETFYNLPNLETSIGGRKGSYVGNYSRGMYADERDHLRHGAPNQVHYQRTFIDPSEVGFSYNSFVNRNTYADFYNHIDERRKNPNFKFITRFNGLELHPARYALPDYPFSAL